MSGNVAKCDSCAAEILWCRSASTGNRMPVDFAPTPKGNIHVAGDYVAVVLSGDDLAEARSREAPLHLNHFVTCPNRAQHRKVPRPGEPRQGELGIGTGPGKR